MKSTPGKQGGRGPPRAGTVQVQYSRGKQRAGTGLDGTRLWNRMLWSVPDPRSGGQAGGAKMRQRHGGLDRQAAGAGGLGGHKPAWRR